jgi:hypothetical protein
LASVAQQFARLKGLHRKAAKYLYSPACGTGL